jgi:hypothetical protein
MRLAPSLAFIVAGFLAACSESNSFTTGNPFTVFAEPAQCDAPSRSVDRMALNRTFSDKMLMSVRPPVRRFTGCDGVSNRSRDS